MARRLLPLLEMDMTKTLAPLLIASALTAGCEPAVDDADGDEGLLLVEASVGDLDLDRIHIGLFELDGAGDYDTTEGAHTGLVRLRVLPEDGSRVRAWAFDGQDFVDEAEVRTITVRPLMTLGLGDMEALDDVAFEMDAPLPPPAESDGSSEAEELPSTVVVPLIWYDADGDGALVFDFDGESESVGALVHDDGDRELTLTHIEFDYVFDGYVNDDSTRGYRTQWLVWAADEANDPSMVTDWSTRWSAPLG